MHSCESAHHGMISHLDVTAQRAVIGENDVVANRTIVPDVTVGQKISAITNPRFAFARGTAMRRHEFAKCVSVANFQISRFTAIFQVLSLLADGTVSVKLVFRAGLHRPTECDMMLQPAIGAEHDARSDYAVGTDDCSCTDFRSRINNRSRMNLHIAHCREPLILILSPWRKGRGEKSFALPSGRSHTACILLRLAIRKGEGMVRVPSASFIEKREHQFA